MKLKILKKFVENKIKPCDDVDDAAVDDEDDDDNEK